MTDLRVLVATDGSAAARAALATIIDVPWPEGTRARAVVARQSSADRRSSRLSTLDRSADAEAANARRVLARRWPDAEARVIDKAPVEGILAEAGRFQSDVIAVGWRGHGAVRRLLMGSVSRGVVRAAKCAVLVVRRRPRRVRRIAIGFDGSPHALRAVTLIGQLVPPPDGRVTLIGVVELMATPSRAPTVAGIRSTIARETRRLNTERSKQAMKALNAAAAELNRRGWRTRTELRTGEPLRELVAAVNTAQHQLLVVGARGTSGLRHLLLGSVAEGVLNRSSLPVLVAR